MQQKTAKDSSVSDLAVCLLFTRAVAQSLQPTGLDLPNIGRSQVGYRFRFQQCVS